MEFEQKNIGCNIFLDAEAVIKKTEVKVKEAKTTKERQYYAQDILLEAKTLLSCLSYNSKDPSCLSCHSVLERYIQEYEYLANHEKQEILIKREFHV